MVRAEGEISNGDFFVPLFQSLCGGEMHVGVWAQNGSSFFSVFSRCLHFFPPYIARQKEMEKKNFPIKTGVWSRRRVLGLFPIHSDPAHLFHLLTSKSHHICPDMKKEKKT